MPKKKNNKDSVSDQFETLSVVSNRSDDSTTPVSSIGVENDAEVCCTVDNLHGLVDSLDSKHLETRVKTLHLLLNSFRKEYFSLDSNWNYVETFLDSIESILKKGRISDQKLAADVLSVFCLQYDSVEIPSIFEKFYPVLNTWLRDSSASCVLRASCATSLAILQSLSGHCDFLTPMSMLENFENVFRIGGNKQGKLGESVNELYIAALNGWTLVYTHLNTYDAGVAGKSLIPTIINLLKGSNADVRMAAGETIAVIYERIRNEIDAKFNGPYYANLIELLQNLSTDNSKNHSKLDRKKTRKTFRDLMDSIIHGVCSEKSVQLGSENLNLTSVSDNFRYDYLCSILSSGLKLHLKYNVEIRGFFNLGLPIAIKHDVMDRRAIRNQKKFENMYFSKQRTLDLSYIRDKRSDMNAGLDLYG